MSKRRSQVVGTYIYEDRRMLQLKCAQSWMNLHYHFVLLRDLGKGLQAKPFAEICSSPYCKGVVFYLCLAKV